MRKPFTLSIDLLAPWRIFQGLWAWLRRSVSSPRLPCPDCVRPMKPLKFGRTIVDECRACAGMWLDAQELEALAKLPLTPLNLIARYPANSDLVCVAPNERCCPCCDQLLGLVPLLDQEVLTCRQCGGFWILHGQMGPLLRAKRSPAVRPQAELDWRCGYCESLNLGTIDLCRTCGGPKPSPLSPAPR